MRDDLLSSVNKVPDNAVILCGAGESSGGGAVRDEETARG